MATAETQPVDAAMENTKQTTNTDTQKKNRIQVSNTKKPLFFYVNLAKVSRDLPFLNSNPSV